MTFEIIQRREIRVNYIHLDQSHASTYVSDMQCVEILAVKVHGRNL